MESLLHYVFKHRLAERTLRLVDSNSEVEIISVGQHNTDEGADFFNAKVRFDGVVWAGNIELHVCEDDWYAHQHHTNAAYNNTILHVVEHIGARRAVTHDGKVLPTVVMTIPQKIKTNYEALLRCTDYPRCHTVLPTLDDIKVHTWLEALLAERMRERATLVAKRASENGGDWEKAFFITLARNFGFGKNGIEFEQFAERLPLQCIAHHRDDLFQVTAMFLGVAGLIDHVDDDAYAERLQGEYNYLRRKFASVFEALDLLPPIKWRYMRMRPQTFPHVRLIQLAELYHKGDITLANVVDGNCVDKLVTLSKSMRQLVIINTITPVLFAYGEHQHRYELCERALSLLEQLPSENNHITRQWQACGIRVDTAAYSQALIQLKSTRCDNNDCLRCRFAYEFLRI